MAAPWDKMITHSPFFAMKGQVKRTVKNIER
jgi:hypothetical protein